MGLLATPLPAIVVVLVFFGELEFGVLEIFSIERGEFWDGQNTARDERYVGEG